MEKKKKKLNGKSQKQILFIDFILNPIFKLIFFIFGETTLHLKKFIQNEIGIHDLNLKEITSCRNNLISYCMALFFGGCRDLKIISNHTGLISSINEHLSHFENEKKFLWPKFFKKKKNFIGYIGKIFPNHPEKCKFIALTRIFKGRIKSKNFVSLISEGHEVYFEQNFRCFSMIKKIFLPVGRYSIKIPKVYAGSLVFLDGIENLIKKSAIFYEWTNIPLEIEKNFMSILQEISYFGFCSIFSFYIQPSSPHQLKNLLNTTQTLIAIGLTFGD
jgi:translation elongation factor EF-G